MSAMSQRLMAQANADSWAWRDVVVLLLEASKELDRVEQALEVETACHESASRSNRRNRERADKAERSLLVYGYTDCGGEYWKPPLGKRPAWLDGPYGTSPVSSGVLDPPVVDSALRQAFADLDWVAMLKAAPEPAPDPGVMTVAQRQLWNQAYHCRQRAEIRA